MITPIKIVNRKSYCLDCQKHFTGRRLADHSGSVHCPNCGSTAAVVNKLHPWYPEVPK